MAKGKCAYHLCGKPLDPKRVAEFKALYCDSHCRRNAKQWRWRTRKPAARAAQQHRWWLKKQAAGIKRTYAARRRPLVTKVEKKAVEDGRETSTDQVG